MIIIDYFKKNYGIIIIILISILLHLLVLNQLGIQYNLRSDDLSYVNSGIHFLNVGEITLRGTMSAQIMPGMTYLIAFFSLIFGEGILLWWGLKILWIIMGVCSVFGIYKIVTLFTKKLYGCISASFLLVIDFIWMDNLILTETPFMLAFIFLIYSTFALIIKKENKYYFHIIIWYFAALLFKGNIAPYPLFLGAYLLLQKYPWKLLIKQSLIAGLVLSIFFIPWIVRNYKLYDKFIPLTYGVGNPLLLGTYQGYNYPLDNFQEYKKHADSVMSEEMKSYVYDNNTYKSYKKPYFSLEYDKIIAEFRMKQWWNNDKISMLKSYLYYKPKILVRNSFYWDEVFNIPKKAIINIRDFDIILTLISIIVIMFNKKYIKELFFLVGIYLFQIAVYSYTFAFDRYGQTLYFIRFIIIGIGLSLILPKLYKHFKRFLPKFSIK